MYVSTEPGSAPSSGVARRSTDDVAWFEQLFAACYDDLLRYAARRIGTESAEDVVAEVFLTAWRRRDDYAHDTARLWLFGVARRVVANFDRGRTRSLRLAAKAASMSGDAEADHADEVVTGMRVREVLASLPPAEAESLRLTEWDGFDLAQAAAVAGCSRATFRVRLHRARRHAAQRFRDDVPAPALPAADQSSQPTQWRTP